MSAPFVGRQAELNELISLIQRAEAERAPAGGLIEGEPGSGKTRLLAEAARRPTASEVIALAGFEPSQRIPLGAAGPLLRRLARVPAHGALLDRLAFGGPDGEGRDPLRIFEAAHRSAVAQGSLLISIDDVQWVDEQSLALVDYLLRSAGPARHSLVIFAAARPSPASATLRVSLDSELPVERRVSIEVSSLDLEEGLSLARAIDSTLSLAEAERLWRRARGSPFWLEALARTRGVDDPAVVIAERLRSLTSDAGELLGFLAVAGRPVPHDDVADLLGWTRDRADQAARELATRGLSLSSGSGAALAHDLIRESVAAGMPAATLQRFRVRLIDWLESAGGDDLQLLSEALGHRQAVGLPTAALAAKILESPRRRLLGPENLRTLASISDTLPPGTPDQLAIDRNLGDLAGLLGEQALALVRWRRVSEHALEPDERERAEVEAARAAYRLGRPAEVHAHLDRAKAVGRATAEARARQDALQAEVLLWSEHETHAGARAAERALASAREMVSNSAGVGGLSPDHRRTYFAAFEAAVGAALQEERVGEVFKLTAESLGVGRAVDEESHVAMLLRAGFALRPVNAGRVSEAEAHFRSAWEISRRLVLPLATIEAGHGLARALRDQGRLAEARSIIVATLELEVRLGRPAARWGNAASILHLIELSMGDADALSDLRADADAEPNPHYELAIHQHLGVWLARIGGPTRADDVERELAAARSAASIAGCPRCAAEVTVVSAEALARIGRVGEARQALATWEQRPIEDYPMRIVWRKRARAAIAAAEGDAETAISTLEELGILLEEAGYWEDVAWVRLDVGRVLSGSNRSEAVRALESAAVVADRIGAVTLTRLANQELRRLGVRAWRRGLAATGTGMAALTSREREVADLLAEGRSNREIADALLVAPKTIERHVTNILAKVGVRNRTELATRFRGPGTGFPR
ncbi:MAG TPA: AAA family ATPase [Candidatus Limnocylindria bacterium]|nr:AAA family ATPase [Candidatus Limnocylindria bacterium]